MPAHIRGRAIPATVPGCIHTDLLDAGLIPDPAVGMNENEVQWVSWTDWRYELTFDTDPRLFDHHELDLCFECLDTIAAIELNGHQIGTAASEFIPHRFSVLGLLHHGANTLAVTFTSPLRYIHEQAKKHGPLPVNGDWDPYCYIRKCASNFQWDWGPKVATCGMAAAVVLHAWSTVRVNHVRHNTTRGQQDQWGLRIDAALEWSAKATGETLMVIDAASVGDLDVCIPVTSPIGCQECSVETTVQSPATWTPSKTNVPYPLRVLTLQGSGSTRVPLWEGSIAIRQVAVDSAAGALRLAVNGNPVYCRGANWIPEGLWPRDRTYAGVRRRLEQAAAAGMNMIRVWGGGRYEPDWFYDICDELGLMVWQDFMFSCACYPEHDEYRKLVEAEARYQVARLSRHPSVVLWCGGNECEWAYESWGFKEKLAESGQASRGWGQFYYRDLLPKIIAELAPGTPYIPNSPYSPTLGKHPNDADEGDRHTWDLVGDDFRKLIPRFCSEFGVQSPSTRETLNEAGLALPGTSASGHPLIPPALLARQRGPGGMQRWYDEPLAKLFPPAASFDEWLAQAHEMQARHLYTAIVWLRANSETCSGALVWQLNDAWPGLSWSLIDSAGREKPAYFAVQRAFAPRLIDVVPFDGRPHLVIINDTDEPWAGSHKVDGRDMSFAVKPRSTERIRLRR